MDGVLIPMGRRRIPSGLIVAVSIAVVAFTIFPLAGQRSSKESHLRPLVDLGYIPFRLSNHTATSRGIAAPDSVQASKNAPEVSVSNEDDSLQHNAYDETDLVQQTYEKRLPKVAWIMSYGGSGTSYTILNVEKLTNTTTASNYGVDFLPCIPLRPEWRSGPFVRSPEKQMPEHFILTKTHCGGYCMDCGPSTYLHTPDSFETACLTGQKLHQGFVQSVTYERDIPAKAIHLIRNPFDNLVGRMHLAVKHHLQRGHEAAENYAADYTTTSQGIEAWCAYLDDKYKEQDSATPQLSGFMHVPCRAEWYRYIQWHNLAYNTHSDRLDLPVHYLYYDNYTTAYDETVQEVMKFLELPPTVHEFHPFVPGKTYGSLFTVEQAGAAANMVRGLASPPVWQRLQHFFDHFLS
jgi:hypothetical protein